MTKSPSKKNMSKKQRLWSIVAATLILVLAALTLLSINYWDWLRQVPTGGKSGTATVRNLGLLLLALIALPLTIWRSLVADRQSKASQAQATASQKSASAALKQSALAQKSFLNSRFQTAAEMLGNRALYARMGGIYLLRSLAFEEKSGYLAATINLLGEFAKSRTHSTSARDNSQLREDVQLALTSLGLLNKIQDKREPFALPDLMKANLKGYSLLSDFSHALLISVNLSECHAEGTDFSESRLQFADLTSANLRNANLSKALLQGTAFAGTTLENAVLTGALFGTKAGVASGLTQEQLDTALADPENPPVLDGVVDAKTGQPLVWKGKKIRS